jgi:iron complex outermembrane recepter protein
VKRGKKRFVVGDARCLIAAGYLMTVACAYAQYPKYNFEISDSSMGGALSQLAHQAHVELLYPFQLARIRGVHPVVGRYTVPEALEMLLQGTGFSGGLTSQGVVTISLQNEGCKPEGNVMSPECKQGFSILAVLLGTVSAQASLAQTAYAQANGDTGATVETVVVTGFRESLANALDKKQHSNLIIESVTAEDVGKMPDQNIAESLQRLPGIQIDRSQGKGTQVLINGLRQNLTTLNGDVFLTGKEFYVSGEASNGGAGANSQYNSLEGIPSEEIGRVDVYKSPNASLTEGGLGGIVDLQTRNALDAPEGFSLAANIRGTSTSAASMGNTTPNATLVASYKPNSTFAITGSVSYDAEDTHTKEFEAYNRSPWLIATSGETGYTGTGTLTSAYATTTSDSYIIPEYAYFSDIYDQARTIGATLGVNWNVSESVQTSINWFYSHISDKNITYSDKVGFNGSGSSTGLPGINTNKSYDIDENGVVTAATFWLTGAETATLYQHTNSDANNVQWHTTFDNGGPLTATLDVSWARASSNLQAAQQDVEHGYYTRTGETASAAPTAPGCNNFAATCAAGAGNPAYQVEWTNGGESGLPTATNLAPYADVLSNANYVLFKSAWAWANTTKQQQDAIRGAVVYKPSFLKNVDGSITAGFRIAQRDVWQNFGRYLINRQSTPGVVGSDCCYDSANGTNLYYLDPGYDTQIPYDTALSNPSLAKTVKNFALGDIIVKDPVAGGMTDPSTFLETVWNNAHNVPTGSTTANHTEALYTDTLSSFQVHETTEAAYLMSDLGGENDSFHANFGVRVVLTDLTVHNGQSAAVPTSYGTASWNGVNNNNVAVTHHKYSVDVLPSINFTLNVTDEQKIRFGAARVVSPQDLFSLGLGNSYNYTRETGGRTNINTGLKDGFKFATGSSGNPDLDPYRATQFNLAWEDYFAKGALVSVSTFFKQVDNFVETQNLTATVMDDFGGTSGTISMPVNAGHGKVYGLELASQYAFDNGFGFATNYTFTESTSDQVTAFTDHASIPGVAKHSFTGTVYYENYGFDARLSYSWRSKAVNQGLGGSTFSVTNTLTSSPKIFGVFTAPYGELDAQVTYNINDYVGLIVSGQNLTDEAYHTYLQFPNQPFTYDDSGTRYFFGVRVRY